MESGEDEATWYDRGLLPMKIFYGAQHSGHLYFLVQFFSQERLEYVLANDINTRYPQLVIEYYEENMIWLDGPPMVVRPPWLTFPGFWQGLEPEEIIGAGEFLQGDKVFLMKWKYISEPTFVEAHEAKLTCPELIIAFYQAHGNFPPL